MKNLSKVVLILTIIFCAWFYTKHGKETYLFYGDALGYYSYLPSLFIYDNFYAIQDLPADKGIDQPVLDYVARYSTESIKSPKGTYINQYTYGMAAMELPFFIIAHSYEKLSGGQANGYSIVYHHWMKVCHLFYGLLGLFFLYKILRRFFTIDVSVISSVLLLFGTNLFWFTFYQSGMAHTVLFALYASLIFFTLRLYEEIPKVKNFIMVGLLVGFITVIRPVDLLCVLIPIFYGVSSFELLQARLQWIVRHWKKIILAILAFVLPILPQLIFWKKYAGSFFYYSYGEQSFDWGNPYILEGIFGFKNGWLAYSPIIIICLLGLLFYKKVRPFNLIIWVILPLYIYITYSWWCWNYINGYGSRPMVHLYPLLVFPLAAVVEYFLSAKAAVKLFGFSILLVLALLNINLMMKAVGGKLDSAETNKTFYWSTLFSNNLQYHDLITAETSQLQPDSIDLINVATFHKNSFDVAEDTIQHIFDSELRSQVYYFQEGEEFPQSPMRDTIRSHQNADFVRCEARIRIPEFTDGLYTQPKLAISLRRGDSTLFWKGISLNNKIGWGAPYCTHKELLLNHRHENKWSLVYFFVNTEDITFQKGDVLEYGVWNIPQKELFFDDLKISLWNKK